MSLRLVEKEAAPEAVRRVYESLENAGRPIGNIHKTLANKPELLRSFLQLYGVVMGEGALPLKMKELAYLRTTFLNGCANCARTHTAGGKAKGVTDEQIAALKEPGGRRRDDLFDAAERALLRYVDLLTSYPSTMDVQDLAALEEHFSPEQILEIAATVAMANWTNRINEGLRIPAPAAK
jgi:uncharacterized peroxidase-related enzyme